jgi:hypothetical protein
LILLIFLPCIGGGVMVRYKGVQDAIHIKILIFCLVTAAL